MRRNQHLKRAITKFFLFSNFLFCLASYGDAIAYLDRLRNIEPPIYNQRRISELPLPSLENDPESDISSQFEQSNFNDDSDEDTSTVAAIASLNILPEDPLASDDDQVRIILNIMNLNEYLYFFCKFHCFISKKMTTMAEKCWTRILFQQVST